MKLPWGARRLGPHSRTRGRSQTWTLHGWLIADEQPAIANLLHTASLTHGKGMQSYLTMMAVRLLEMRRALKSTGSIYLHCDPTASHYLKMLMDAIFGQRNFRNEITWKRTSTTKGNFGQGARFWPRAADILLFYSKSEKYGFTQQFGEYSPAYIENAYRYVEVDTSRRYRLVSMIGPGGAAKGNPMYEVLGVARYWRYSEERMRELIEKGLVVQSKPGAVPHRKYYLDEGQGVPIQSVWDDIGNLQASAKERVGYPTQKPLALLERIIKASSNEGDVVLDPFCGCATACVAADKLGRKWVGIDLSPKAIELVNQRLQQAPPLGIGPLFYHGYVTARTDIPRRTDIDAPIPYRQNKHVLFGQQEGLCNGCGVMFPFRNFTVDHMVPQSRGGTDHLDNLQLLCGACNSVKGDRTQEHLIARLKEMAI